MIFVVQPIINRHRMAIYLAIRHTTKEIEKLWTATAGKQLGQTGKALHQAFNMDKNHLQANGIKYRELWPKDKRP